MKPANKKGITSIMEYVLVSLLSILFVIGVLFIFHTAKNIAYRVSFDMQAENIGKKLAYYEHILIADELINTSVYFTFLF
ncbi:MAG: hypothetical protein GXN99_01630, partial [Candidatus Nanohaloarchaeota archaeon]|nr:hypothetical protein [Candidatus Nanohaloarchaeota archaeon]